MQRFPLKIAKTIPIEKKILNLMPAEKNETLEEHIIKKKLENVNLTLTLK